jgi:TolB protein
LAIVPNSRSQAIAYNAHMKLTNSQRPTCGQLKSTSAERRFFLSSAALICAAPLTAVCLPAFAQTKIDVSGIGASQIPIAVAGFAGESGDGILSTLIRRNLTRIGSFRLVPGLAAVADTEAPNYAEWRGKSVDALVVGSVNKLANGRYDVRYRLGDTLKSSVIDSQNFISTESDLRYTAHRICDSILEKLTGEKGIFTSRVAYISKSAGRFRLHVADWDGDSAQEALNSPEPIMSPKWSPDGKQLAYVSFENKKPVVYVQNVYTQQRTAVANFKGSNSAPAWSPDGRTLAVTLTRDGQSQIYLIGADGNNVRRLTNSSAIDTEACFTPDGNSIYFTSDRGGSPQIYRVSAQGGEPARVTFNGNYNVSPRISPDGKRLAYVTRRESRYNIALRDLSRDSGGNDQILSETGRDESPSFAPNSRWILYASRNGGKDELHYINVNGREKFPMPLKSTDVREPAWGPFVL